MTLEQFYEAQKMRDNEFARLCEIDPNFADEYYEWIDYFTVLKLQQREQARSKTS